MEKKEFRKINSIFFISLILFLITFLYSLSLISASSQKYTLSVTSEHPFLIDNEWIPASQLQVGDLMTTVDGKKARITAIKDAVLDSPVNVYNLEAGEYSDFVLENGNVVVHNSNVPPSTPPSCEGPALEQYLRDNGLLEGQGLVEMLNRQRSAFAVRSPEVSSPPLSKANSRRLLKAYLDQNGAKAKNFRDVMSKGNKDANAIIIKDPNGVTRITVGEEGFPVIEFYPNPEKVCLSSIKADVEAGAGTLKNLNELELKLKSLANRIKSGEKLENDFVEVWNRYRQMIDQYRDLVTGKEGPRQAFIVSEQHLAEMRAAHQTIIDHIKSQSDIQSVHIVLSGRGGYPSEIAMRCGEFNNIHRVLTSGGAIPEGGVKYTRLGELIKTLETSSNPGQTLKIAIIEGEEFSGSSITNLRRFLETYRRSNPNVKIEIDVYTFRQDVGNIQPKIDHINNLGKLSKSTVNNDGTILSGPIPGKNIDVNMYAVDVSYVPYADIGHLLGTNPCGSNVLNHGPIIIMNAEGTISGNICTLQSSASNEFSRLMSPCQTPTGCTGTTCNIPTP